MSLSHPLWRYLVIKQSIRHRKFNLMMVLHEKSIKEIRTSPKKVFTFFLFTLGRICSFSSVNKNWFYIHWFSEKSLPLEMSHISFFLLCFFQNHTHSCLFNKWYFHQETTLTCISYQSTSTVIFKKPFCSIFCFLHIFLMALFNDRYILVDKHKGICVVRVLYSFDPGITF